MKSYKLSDSNLNIIFKAVVIARDQSALEVNLKEVGNYDRELTKINSLIETSDETIRKS